MVRCWCADKAGHGGGHDFKARDHSCKSSCQLEGRAGKCNGQCALETGHGGEHRCNSMRHTCLEGCSLPRCRNSCRLPFDQHHERHNCGIRQCTRLCEVEGCECTSVELDHFNTIKEGARHFCGSEHPCSEMCEVVKMTRRFEGARGGFDFEMVSEQEGEKWKCCKTILLSTSRTVVLTLTLRMPPACTCALPSAAPATTCAGCLTAMMLCTTQPTATW